MARIIAYPNATNISIDDCLIGTQKENTGTQMNPTKNFSIGSIIEAGLGYTSYTIILSQSGGAAPIPVELNNTTSATYTWSRTGVGKFEVKASSSIFNANTTAVFLNVGGSSKPDYARWAVTAGDIISVSTYDSAGNPVDGSFNEGAFEIRIYS